MLFRHLRPSLKRLLFDEQADGVVGADAAGMGILIEAADAEEMGEGSDVCSCDQQRWTEQIVVLDDMSRSTSRST